MCLRVSYKKKYEEKINNFFASLKSLKKGVGSADPDPHQMSRIPNTECNHTTSTGIDYRTYFAPFQMTKDLRFLRLSCRSCPF
jgi:hypothetical protein